MENLFNVALVMLKRINPQEEIDPHVQVQATVTSTSIQPPTPVSPPTHAKLASPPTTPFSPPTEPTEPTPQPSEVAVVAANPPEVVSPIATPSKSKTKKSKKN